MDLGLRESVLLGGLGGFFLFEDCGVGLGTEVMPFMVLLGVGL